MNEELHKDNYFSNSVLVKVDNRLIQNTSRQLVWMISSSHNCDSVFQYLELHAEGQRT